MRTYIKIGWLGLMFDGVPSGFLGELSAASIVTEKGYGENRVFEPSKEKIEIELISEQAGGESAVVGLLHEKESELSKAQSRAYTAESELKKLKKQFSLE